MSHQYVGSSRDCIGDPAQMASDESLQTRLINCRSDAQSSTFASRDLIPLRRAEDYYEPVVTSWSKS